jgi:hypothetical protein
VDGGMGIDAADDLDGHTVLLAVMENPKVSVGADRPVKRQLSSSSYQVTLSPNPRVHGAT